MTEPNDKDLHGMYTDSLSAQLATVTAERDAARKDVAWYQRQSGNRDDYLVQIKHVCDQCAKIIGEDAYGVPFQMAVMMSLDELTKRAELAEVPEGSVKVRIAVGVSPATMPHRAGDYFVSSAAEHASEPPCIELVFLDDDTHRGIVEAWIPKVPEIPVVQGVVR